MAKGPKSKSSLTSGIGDIGEWKQCSESGLAAEGDGLSTTEDGPATGENEPAAEEMGLKLGKAAIVTVEEALEEEGALGSASLESSSSRFSCL